MRYKLKEFWLVIKTNPGNQVVIPTNQDLLFAISKAAYSDLLCMGLTNSHCQMPQASA